MQQARERRRSRLGFFGVLAALVPLGIAAYVLSDAGTWSVEGQLTLMWALTIVLLVAMAVVIVLSVRAARRGDPEPDPEDDAIPDVPSALRALAPVVVGAFVLAGATARDLWRLETGEVEHVFEYAPVALIYEHLGFWPAVLAAPVGMLLLVVYVALRVSRTPRTPAFPEPPRSGT